MRVIVQDSALADLDDIYAWIAKTNPVAAAFVLHRIFDSIDLLSLFPYIGRKGVVEHTFEWPTSRLPYMLVYRLDEDFDELIVLAVFNTSRDR